MYVQYLKLYCHMYLKITNKQSCAVGFKTKKQIYGRIRTHVEKEGLLRLVLLEGKFLRLW